jgi:hypothetical protein
MSRSGYRLFRRGSETIGVPGSRPRMGLYMCGGGPGVLNQDLQLPCPDRDPAAERRGRE